MNDIDNDTTANNEHTSSASSISNWILHFLFFIQAKFRLPDSVTSCHLKFLIILFGILSVHSRLCMDVYRSLPSSLFATNKLRGSVAFTKYVVCNKCHSIRKYQKSICATDKLCSNVAFPDHPQHSRRKSCDMMLFETVELASGKTLYYPGLTYCYVNVDLSLQILLKRPELYSKCELWRSRKCEDNYLSDIYDGNVWKDFNTKYNLFSQPNNYAVMLNLDFFQPFKHIQYSLGAIYLTVLNLPQNMRQR